MVKRGLSKSMKKRISALMNKKKLTVKDKKFLAKIQKGGEWLKPWTWFSSQGNSATNTATSDTQAASSSGDDHTVMKQNICKICKATSADCDCEDGPSIDASQAQPVETPSSDVNSPLGTDSTATSSADGNVNSGADGNIPPNTENPENAVPPPGQRGGRRSRKNKRRGSKKSKKMSCLW